MQGRTYILFITVFPQTWHIALNTIDLQQLLNVYRDDSKTIKEVKSDMEIGINKLLWDYIREKNISSWKEERTFHEGGRIWTVLKKEEGAFQVGMHQEKGKKNSIYKEIKLIFFRPLSIQSIGKWTGLEMRELNCR